MSDCLTINGDKRLEIVDSVIFVITVLWIVITFKPQKCYNKITVLWQCYYNTHSYNKIGAYKALLLLRVYKGNYYGDIRGKAHRKYEWINTVRKVL